MRLGRKIRSAVVDFLLRLSPPRPVSSKDLRQANFSTHPGGQGLRFTDLLRNRLRAKWVRIGKQARAKR